ncbi:MAG: coenzyme F420-0:L-glutamate ligase [Candidatus Saccharibacteria bacterium]|nr:coenzyme F420-0:L-glutamate ligase [Candidatus Saccharibacteria bacterium]
MKIEFLPIKTRLIRPPKDNIFDIIDSLEVKEGDIVFITSKILAIHQGRTRKIGEYDKDALIRSEAERFLPYVNDTGDFHVNLTVTQNVLIAAAGIDESNADGYYILWPEKIDALCSEIRERLMRKFGLTKLGVVATDSHTTPLRWGVTGIAIGLAGVEPLEDIRGKSDLFGREMRVTKVNLIDPLAAMAVRIMGEGAEQTPITILRGYEGISFSETGSMKDFKIEPELDLYRALIEVMPKVKE